LITTPGRGYLRAGDDDRIIEISRARIGVISEVEARDHTDWRTRKLARPPRTVVWRQVGTGVTCPTGIADAKAFDLG
jgi:hypothetical protein